MAFNPTAKRAETIIAALIEQFPHECEMWDAPEYRKLDRFEWGLSEDTHAFYWELDWELTNSILERFNNPFDGRLFLEPINSAMIGIYSV